MPAVHLLCDNHNMTDKRITASFFDDDALHVAVKLIGKRVNFISGGLHLHADIVETEAYYLSDKASHASLGYTEKRRALFSPAGTVYMYYARGKDSFNVSCRGEGDAVLIKSALTMCEGAELLKMMNNNPKPSGEKRERNKLCSGQTLVCASLGLKVRELDCTSFSDTFYISDTGYRPDKVIFAKRLGIPHGRDEHLRLRVVDEARRRFCTKNPPPSKPESYEILSYEDALKRRGF